MKKECVRLVLFSLLTIVLVSSYVSAIDNNQVTITINRDPTGNRFCSDLVVLVALGPSGPISIDRFGYSGEPCYVGPVSDHIPYECTSPTLVSSSGPEYVSPTQIVSSWTYDCGDGVDTSTITPDPEVSCNNPYDFDYDIRTGFSHSGASGFYDVDYGFGNALVDYDISGPSSESINSPPEGFLYGPSDGSTFSTYLDYEEVGDEGAVAYYNALYTDAQVACFNANGLLSSPDNPYQISVDNAVTGFGFYNTDMSGTWTCYVPKDVPLSVNRIDSVTDTEITFTVDGDPDGDGLVNIEILADTDGVGAGDVKVAERLNVPYVVGGRSYTVSYDIDDSGYDTPIYLEVSGLEDSCGSPYIKDLSNRVLTPSAPVIITPYVQEILFVNSTGDPSSKEAYNKNVKVYYKKTSSGIPESSLDSSEDNLRLQTYNIDPLGENIDLTGGYVSNRVWLWKTNTGTITDSDGDTIHSGGMWYYIDGRVSTDPARADFVVYPSGWMLLRDVTMTASGIGIGSQTTPSSRVTSDTVRFQDVWIWGLLPHDFKNSVDPASPTYNFINPSFEADNKITVKTILSSRASYDGSEYHVFDIPAKDSNIVTGFSSYGAANKEELFLFASTEGRSKYRSPSPFSYLNTRPNSDSLIDPEPAVVGGTVTLESDCSDIESGTTPSSWKIDGTGYSGTPIKTITFATPGTKEINVTCVDEVGSEKTGTKTLEVLAPGTTTTLVNAVITNESGDSLNELGIFGLPRSLSGKIPSFLDIFIGSSLVAKGEDITLGAEGSYIMDITTDLDGDVTDVDCLEGDCPDTVSGVGVDKGSSGTLGDASTISWIEEDGTETAGTSFVVSLSEGAEEVTLKVVSDTGESDSITKRFSVESEDRSITTIPTDTFDLESSRSEVSLPFFSIGNIIWVVAIIAILYLIKVSFFDKKNKK